MDTDSEDEESRVRPSRALYTIEECDEELDTIEDIVSQFKCVDEIEQAANADPIVNEEDPEITNQVVTFDLDQLYERKIEDFEIEIGSKKIPRYSCACHKINLVVRQAILLDVGLSTCLTAMNEICAGIRRSVKLSAPFRCENKTRYQGLTFIIK